MKKIKKDFIENQIVNILAKKLCIKKIQVKPESSLVDDLGADSLGIIEIIIALEEEFKVEIQDKDAQLFNTVQDITSFLQKNLELTEN